MQTSASAGKTEPFKRLLQSCISIALLVISFSTDISYAASCSGTKGKTVNFNFSAINIASLPANAPIITPLTDWISQTINVFDLCTSGGPIEVGVYPSTSVMSGKTYTDNGTSYTIWTTPNPAIGMIMKWQPNSAASSIPIQTYYMPNNPSYNIPSSSNNQPFIVNVSIRFIRYAAITDTSTSPIASNKGIFHWLWQYNTTSVMYTELALNGSSFSIQTKSCTVLSNNIPVTLPPIQSTLLPTLDATAGSTPFNVGLSCPNPVNVYMTINDNNDPTSTAAFISASSDATSKGVGVQLSSNGNIVRMGPDSSLAGTTNQFLVGLNQTGTVYVPLIASYIRTGALQAGTLKARATFTMSYQ